MLYRMANRGKPFVLYGSIAAAAGLILILFATLWKNSVVQTADVNDGIIVGATIDELLVGGLVLLGGLCVIAAIVLFVAAWFHGQRNGQEPLGQAETPNTNTQAPEPTYQTALPGQGQQTASSQPGYSAEPLLPAQPPQIPPPHA